MTFFTASAASAPPALAPAPGRGVSPLRLNMLRGGYGLLAVGLGLYMWPTVVHHAVTPAVHGTLVSLLAGLGATAVLGLRYPLRMLPLLIFEMVWKTIYLLAFALPLNLAHRIDDAAAADIGACLMVVIFVPLIPWRHLAATYIMAPSERWA
jgi:hypothetical protein